MTQISLDDLHALLLRQAGQLPDPLLTELRYSLALGDRLGIAQVLTSVTQRFGLRLAAEDRALLTELLGGADGTPTATTESATAPARYRFTPVAPEVIPEGIPVPAALDLTGSWAACAEFADRVVDGIDATVLNAVGRYQNSVAVWRTWRCPVTAEAGNPVRGKRIYLVEISPSDCPAVVAAEIAASLDAAGEPAGQVEVYRTGALLPDYQRQARFGGALLWAAVRTGPRVPAPYGQPEIRFDRDHPRLTDVHDIIRYLRTAPLVATARQHGSDVVDPQRAATVPMDVRTDGAWVWPEAAAYYLAEYGLAPDPEFLAHIYAAGPPPQRIPDAAFFRAQQLARDLLSGNEIRHIAVNGGGSVERIAPVSAAVLRAAWSRLPTRLDLTDPLRFADLRDLLIDRVDTAVISAAAEIPGAVGLWRTWHFPADGPVRDGERHYLLEMSSLAAIGTPQGCTARAAVAGQLNRTRSPAGQRNGAVGVYVSGEALTAAQARMRANAALLWARPPQPQYLPRLLDRLRASLPLSGDAEGVERFRRDLAAGQRRTPVRAFRNELRRNRFTACDRVRPPLVSRPVQVSELTYADGHPPLDHFWPQLRHNESAAPARRRRGADSAGALRNTTDLLISWWPTLTGDHRPPGTVLRGWQVRRRLFGTHVGRVICRAQVELDSPVYPALLLTQAREALVARGIRVRDHFRDRRLTEEFAIGTPYLSGTIRGHRFCVWTEGNTPGAHLLLAGRWMRVPAAQQIPVWPATERVLFVSPGTTDRQADAREWPALPTPIWRTPRTDIRRAPTSAPLPAAPAGISEYLAARVGVGSCPADDAPEDGFYTEPFDLRAHLDRQARARRIDRREVLRISDSFPAHRTSLSSYRDGSSSGSSGYWAVGSADVGGGGYSSCGGGSSSCGGGGGGCGGGGGGG